MSTADQRIPTIHPFFWAQNVRVKLRAERWHVSLQRRCKGRDSASLRALACAISKDHRQPGPAASTRCSTATSGRPHSDILLPTRFVGALFSVTWRIKATLAYRGHRWDGSLTNDLSLRAYGALPDCSLTRSG